MFFDFGVDFDMISQSVEAGKALATVLTFEGLLLVVPDHVQVQAVGPGEGLVADAALERFLP